MEHLKIGSTIPDTTFLPLYFCTFRAYEAQVVALQQCLDNINTQLDKVRASACELDEFMQAQRWHKALAQNFHT